eukprot:4483446-Karenia_brevis.AAC.1
MRAYHALRASQVFAECPTQFAKEVMLSSGGRMVGKLWTEMPSYSGHWFDNDHFRMSLQLRLGMVTVPDGAVCQITKNSGDKCLHTLTEPLVHPHVCKMGPARLRPHRN